MVVCVGNTLLLYYLSAYYKNIRITNINYFTLAINNFFHFH